MAEREGQASFDCAAEAYVRARPAYPHPAVVALITNLGLAPGGHVVDLGAGTGILSHQLAAHGLTVTAVEPTASMRLRIIASDRVRPHAGYAESTGLPDGCADAVVAGTAWHWFDARRAIVEVRRLLEPGRGGLGMLWNLYDESVDWVAEYADISYRRRAVDSPSARDGAWRDYFDGLAGWEPLQEARWANEHTMTPEQLVERLLSSSAIASLAPADQDDVRHDAWAVLRRYGLEARPQIDLPYVTSLYWTKPLPDLLPSHGPH